MTGDSPSRRRSGRQNPSPEAAKPSLEGAAEAAAPKIRTEEPDLGGPYVLRYGDLGVEMPNPADASPEILLSPDVHAEHVPGKRSFLKLRGRLGELAILCCLLPTLTLWLGHQAHLSSEMLGTIIIVGEAVGLATIAIHRYFDDRHSNRVHASLTRTPKD